MTDATGRKPLSTLAADSLLLSAAVIWGTTFVAQKMATLHMGPVLFNGIRYAFGALLVLPLAIRGWRMVTDPRARRNAIVGGLLAGAAMAVASTTQQVGMQTASVSSAGFITGLYVIFVPLLGLLVGQRVRWPVWIGALLALCGMFFLSAYNPNGGVMEVNTGDLWILACAVAWAMHVQIVGWAAPTADPFVISTVQFAVTGVVCLVGALVLSTVFADSPWGAREAFDWDSLRAAALPLAFAAVMSTGVAFTFQVIAQGSAPPAHAAIILSLESVFSALAEAACLLLGGTAWAWLGAPMTRWKLLGSALMFAGVLVSQVRLRQWKRLLGAAPSAT
ncbi:MAG: DMT family transporter [Phycisphaerae bacterium]|nr:DMT family transporter [Phycisphaerae bacterium]